MNDLQTALKKEPRNTNGDNRKAWRMQEKHEMRRLLQIGQKLRCIRKKYHMTQDEVASEMSMNRSGYSFYENDINVPDIYTLFRLAEIYRLSPEGFIHFLASSSIHDDLNF